MDKEEKQEESDELKEAWDEIVAALNDYRIYGWEDRLEDALKLVS